MHLTKNEKRHFFLMQGIRAGVVMYHLKSYLIMNYDRESFGTVLFCSRYVRQRSLCALAQCEHLGVMWVCSIDNQIQHNFTSLSATGVVVSRQVRLTGFRTDCTESEESFFLKGQLVRIEEEVAGVEWVNGGRPRLTFCARHPAL